MPRPLLLSALSDNWAYMAPFLASGLALMTGYMLSILTSRRNAVATHSTETANEKKAWRESILLSIETNKEAIKAEKSERILEENAAAQKLLAGIVSTTRHLEGGQLRSEQDIREIRGHISTIQAQLVTLATMRNANP